MSLDQEEMQDAVCEYLRTRGIRVERSQVYLSHGVYAGKNVYGATVTGITLDVLPPKEGPYR